MLTLKENRVLLEQCEGSLAEPGWEYPVCLEGNDGLALKELIQALVDLGRKGLELRDAVNAACESRRPDRMVDVFDAIDDFDGEE